MGSGAAAYQAGPGMPAPAATSTSSPPTAAALADFSKGPPTRRTSVDLFSTVAKQPQPISACTDHGV